MILRVGAWLSLLLGVSALLAYLHVLGRGPFATPEARHLRSMKDRTATPANVQDFTFADFAALPVHRPLAEYAARERGGARLEGYVHHLLPASDGDLHLELSPESKAENPLNAPYVTTELTPAFRRGSARWRYPALVAALRPSIGGTTAWEAGPRRARISGWLLYDGLDAPRPGWQPRITDWEIHPITRIELWDDTARAFVEYPR